MSRTRGPTLEAPDLDRSSSVARERTLTVCDPRTFVELSPDRGAAGDGVITGWGLIADRPVVVVSHDFSVAGGSISSRFAEKVVRAQRLSVDRRIPIVFLNDSAGARVHEGVRALHGCGRIFMHNVAARRVVPQVSVILGPCAGAAAYSPALTDWTIIVRGRGQMFLTGPEIVRAATGETVDLEDLGGALLHTHDSGVAHLDVADEREALFATRQLLGFLPQSVGDALPWTEARPPSGVLPAIPDNPGRPFNMRRILAAILDDAPPLELQPRFGPSLLVGFARLDGVPVGIVASQPNRRGGILDARSAAKGARFVSFCGRFGIPILTFVDVPGFLPGSTEERRGVIELGARLVAAYVEAEVPKLTVIVRKAYGGAFIALGSRSLGGDFAWAWECAELAVMGPEAAVGLMHRRELQRSADVAGLRRKLAAEYRESVARPDAAVEAGVVDEVIHPSQTRERLVSALRLCLRSRRSVTT